MLKTLTAIAIAATFYVGEAELFEQAFAALDTVQIQQAAAIEQIRRVQRPDDFRHR